MSIWLTTTGKLGLKNFNDMVKVLNECLTENTVPIWNDCALSDLNYISFVREAKSALKMFFIFEG